MCKYLAVGLAANTAYSGPDINQQRVLRFVSAPFEADDHTAAVSEAQRVADKARTSCHTIDELRVYPLAGEPISVPLLVHEG